VPSLDLCFADTKSLVCATTGQNLVTHTRASSGTFVGSDGVLRSAVTNLLFNSSNYSSSWFQSNVTPTYNTTEVIDPVGGNTATKFVVGTSAGAIGQGLNPQTAISHTASIYLRTDTGTTTTDILLYRGSPFGLVALKTVTLTTAWQRFDVTGTFLDNTSHTFQVNFGSSKTVYVWGAQVEQASSVGEYIPTTSVINSAPRFDHAITSSTTNLLLRSEDFTQAPWALFGTASRSANVATAPDGTLTADSLTIPIGSGIFQGVTLTAGLTLTFSVYIRCNTTQTVRILINTNLSDPVTKTVTATTEWQRFDVTKTTAAGTNLVTPQIDTGSGNTFFLWGAQLEQSSTVGPYVPTTTAAATSFGTESLGLLVEEARTNSIRNNTMVGAVAGTPGTLPTNWSLSQNAALTQQIVGAGTSNGIAYLDIKLSGTSSGNAVNVNLETISIAAANGQSWTFSSYLALVGGSASNVTGLRLRAALYSSVPTYLGELVATPSDLTGNLSSVLVRQAATTGTIANSLTAFIQPYIAISVGSGVAIDFTLRIGMPQLEQGAFATSVIPTVGAGVITPGYASPAVTRAADVASITGANFGTTRTNLLPRSEEFGASWTSSNITVSPDAIVAPNGTLTADKMIATTTNAAHQLYQITSGTSGVTYTISFYVKAGEYNRFNFGPGNTAVGGDKVVAINLGLSNPIVSQDAIFNSSAFAAPVGNGWYRVGCTFTATATGTMTVAVLQTIINNAGSASFAGDGTSGIFLWGAQLETGSAATPYIPSTTTFTSRASGASYFNAAGVLQWKPQNLLVQSQAITISLPWGSQSTAPAITANAFAAPDGTTTATRVTFAAADSRVIQTPISLTSGTIYTLSVYARPVTPGTLNTIRLAVFDTGQQNGPDITLISGWQRITYTFTAGGTNTNGSIQFRNATNNAANDVYLWGAQLEQNAGSFTVPGEYTPTVATATGGARDSAFLPDSSGVFRSAGPLLLEEARTNFVQHSETFAAGWVIGGFTSSTAAITSPSGRSGVYSANETSAVNIQHLVAFLLSIPGSTPYTFSFFAKANQRNSIALRYYFADTNWVTRVFDLSGSGALTQSSAGSSADVTSISQSIVACPNGWYRISLTLTQPTTRSAYFSIDGCTTSTPTLAADSGIQLYTGDVNKGYYLWGAQEEAGTYPSSYIPTATAQVTRAADVSTSTATSVFESSWYNQTEGSFFCSTFAPKGTILYGTGDTFDNTQYVAVGSINTVSIRSGNAVSAILTAPISTTALTNIAHGYAVNNFAAVSNGGAISTDTTGNVPLAQVRLKLGSSAWDAGGDNNLNGTIKRLVYWGQRLPNNVLQAITQ
jgi:hypothetical protein